MVEKQQGRYLDDTKRLRDESPNAWQALLPCRSHHPLRVATVRGYPRVTAVSGASAAHGVGALLTVACWKAQSNRAGEQSLCWEAQRTRAGEQLPLHPGGAEHAASPDHGDLVHKVVRDGSFQSLSPRHSHRMFHPPHITSSQIIRNYAPIATYPHWARWVRSWTHLRCAYSGRF